MRGSLLLLGLLLLPLLAWQRQNESLILSPDLHGSQRLGTVEIVLGYGTVREAHQMLLSTGSDSIHVDFAPPLSSTVRSLMLNTPAGLFLVDKAGEAAPVPDGHYLIYFDTIAVYAQHEQDPEALYTLGMLEEFHPALPLRAQRPGWRVDAAIRGGRHLLTLIPPDGEAYSLVAASHRPHYQNRYVGQDLTNAASFAVLGWATHQELPDLLRAMLPPVPHGLDLAAPGEQESPLPLLLPFDCTQDWQVSWGFHYSTPQNYYAVDFTTLGGPGSSLGLPVRAGLDGSLWLKQYGDDSDLGLAAKIQHADGITALVYGHLSAETLRLWGQDSLPAYEWVEVGSVLAGEVLGFVGDSGYATGAHIHLALWTYGQSIYRPVFGPLRDFERGRSILAARREDCARYP